MIRKFLLGCACVALSLNTVPGNADDDRKFLENAPDIESKSVEDPVTETFIKSWCSDKDNECSKADREKAKKGKDKKADSKKDESEKVIADPSCDSNPLVNC